MNDKNICDSNQNKSQPEAVNSADLSGAYTPGVDQKKIEAAQKLQSIDSAVSNVSRFSGIVNQVINVFRFFKTII